MVVYGRGNPATSAKEKKKGQRKKKYRREEGRLHDVRCQDFMNFFAFVIVCLGCAFLHSSSSMIVGKFTCRRKKKYGRSGGRCGGRGGEGSGGEGRRGRCCGVGLCFLHSFLFIASFFPPDLACAVRVLYPTSTVDFLPGLVRNIME